MPYDFELMISSSPPFQAAVIEQEIDNLRSEMKNWDLSKADTQDKKRERKEKALASLNKNIAKEEVFKKLKTIK